MLSIRLRPLRLSVLITVVGGSVLVAAAQGAVATPPAPPTGSCAGKARFEIPVTGIALLAVTPAERERREAGKDAPPVAAGGVDKGKVIAALRNKAYRGDTAAARELREWLRQGDPEAQPTSALLTLLDEEQLATVRGWLEEHQKAPA